MTVNEAAALLRWYWKARTYFKPSGRNLRVLPAQKVQKAVSDVHDSIEYFYEGVAEDDGP